MDQLNKILFVLAISLSSTSALSSPVVEYCHEAGFNAKNSIRSFKSNGFKAVYEKNSNEERHLEFVQKQLRKTVDSPISLEAKLESGTFMIKSRSTGKWVKAKRNSMKTACKSYVAQYEAGLLLPDIEKRLQALRYPNGAMPNNENKLTYKVPEICQKVGSPKGTYLTNHISSAQKALKVVQDNSRIFLDKVGYVSNSVGVEQQLLISESGVKQAQEELRLKSAQIIKEKEIGLDVEAENPKNQNYMQINACKTYHSEVNSRIKFHNIVEDIYTMILPQAIDHEKLEKERQKRYEEEQQAKKEREQRELAAREEQKERMAQRKERLAELNSQKSDLIKQYNAHKPKKVLVTIHRKDSNGNIEAYSSEHGLFVLFDPKSQISSAGTVWLELEKTEITFSRKDNNGFTQEVNSYVITDEGSKAFNEWVNSSEAISLQKKIEEVDAAILKAKSN